VTPTEITPPTSIRIGETEYGRGVIAIAEIEEGETIEICPILELAEGDASGLLDDYTVSLGDSEAGAALLLGYGSLYNHSEEPNAEYIATADDAYSFVALRDIEAGEQITISYGEEWWRTRETGHQ
jgi:SET domain-containing protein